MYKGLTLLCTLCFLVLSSSGESCDSIEEGEFWNFRCTVSNFNQSIDFQVERGGSFETVTSCNKQQICQSFDSNYNSTLKRRLITNSETGHQVSVYQSQLEMKNVRRDENHFRCFVGGYPRAVACEFDIYVKPKKPTCDTPVLTSSGQMLSVTCKTDQVYPNARCIFSSDALPANISVPVTYNNNQSPVRPGDVSTECEGRIPVSALFVGRHQFQVTMYADVKDGKEKTSIKSDLTDIIELSLPRVAIASDCPVGPGVKNGFIEKGTTATCKCELRYLGSPPGHAQWYTSDGVAVGVMNHDGSATLRLAYDASDSVPNDVGGQMNGNDDKKGDNSIYPFVGMGILGFVLVIVIIVAVCLYRRKKPSSCKTQMYATHDNAGQGGYAGDDIYDLPTTDHGYAEPVDIE